MTTDVEKENDDLAPDYTNTLLNQAFTPPPSSTLLTPEQRKKIRQDSFHDVATFYNENETSFKSFQKKSGIDLWFFNHLRTYLTYRNLSLNHNHTATKKSKKGKLKTLLQLFLEIVYILITYKPIKNTSTEYLILSNAHDIVNGKNKRFGALELAFESLFNRPLFDPKKELSRKSFAPKNEINSDQLLVKSLFRPHTWAILYRFIKSLKVLKKELSVQHSNTDSKHDIINAIFWKDQASFIIYYLRYLSFDAYFKKSSLKGILMSDENSPQQKAIQYAANNNQIKVFAFQHGNIHSLHPAYIYKHYTTLPLLPDITFTWGTYFTDLLQTEGAYPTRQLYTSGRISPLNEPNHLNPLVDTSNALILYASQPHRDLTVRHTLTKDVFLAIKKLAPRYTLIIRPHPSEKDDDYFHNIAKEVDFKDFIIDRDTDLKTHMDICTLLIVAFSTVGTEFISYYKPMIVLDYLHQDLIGWMKEGVGIPVVNQQDLVTKLSDSNLKIDKLAYDQFIENYFYKTDGKATERVKQAIYEHA